jgi:hypothetical protein
LLYGIATGQVRARQSEDDHRDASARPREQCPVLAPTAGGETA